MRFVVSLFAALPLVCTVALADDPRKPQTLVIKPDAFSTLVNPSCSHCRDEAKRRAGELKQDDPVLCWTRGYSDGGAVPMRFFLAPYRVISDSYGVFVYDPDAGFARGFAPSYDFRFHGWRNGVMVMRHQDGTLYSALSGLAFDGPKKGTRLKAAPTLVSAWGHWLEHYPNAVAYHMFDKYKPTELPANEAADSVRSRLEPDGRLEPRTAILGVWTGKTARAYPISVLEKNGILTEQVDGETLYVLWEPKTHSAAAYRAVAGQARKFRAPAPDANGVSKPDEGIPVPEGTPALPLRRLSLHLAAMAGAGRFRDEETKSLWDVAGRCTAGTLEGWTLEWVDSVEVKWFAWAAEYPDTTIYGRNE